MSIWMFYLYFSIHLSLRSPILAIALCWVVLVRNKLVCWVDVVTPISSRRTCVVWSRCFGNTVVRLCCCLHYSVRFLRLCRLGWRHLFFACIRSLYSDVMSPLVLVSMFFAVSFHYASMLDSWLRLYGFYAWSPSARTINFCTSIMLLDIDNVHTILIVRTSIASCNW